MASTDTQIKGSIVRGKLKTQKELKKITDSKEYKDADYNEKTKMLNVATMSKGGRAKLKGGGRSQKKKDQGDILGDRFDKKFKKYASSKEAQLHAKDFDKGVSRGESRAAKEVAQEIGMPMRSGGRARLKVGGIAKRGVSKILRKR